MIKYSILFTSINVVYRIGHKCAINLKIKTHTLSVKTFRKSTRQTTERGTIDNLSTHS